MVGFDLDVIASSENDTDQNVLVDTRSKTKRPPLYKVLLLNDDYTPMEFVVLVLERFFGMNHAQAFDSTWPGYAVGADVMKGYMLSAKEIVEQCPEPPTHLFLQAGVGGLAAAMALYLRETYGPDLRIIVVEPDRAPALQAAVQLGTLCDAGEGVSSMGRLDCKRASLSALDALARNANDFMTLTDQDVEKELPRLSELGLDTSPSGGAGLAAALIGASQGEFGLKATSRVMCIVSEGAVND